MLYSIPEFRRLISESTVTEEPAASLKAIFTKLSAPGTGAISIKEEFLRLHCLTNESNDDKMTTQEDAGEFISRCIFGKLHEQGVLPPDFLMSQKDEIKCGSHLTYGPTYPNISIIPIMLATGLSDIQNNLMESMKDKNVERIPAECGGVYEKKLLYTGAPAKYVFVVLTRFLPVMVKGRLQIKKINDSIEIDNTLNIPFANGLVPYKIKGFISHEGATQNRGHYYYSGKTEDGLWRRYNDTTIENLGYDDSGFHLDMDADGDALEKKKAYILLYELVEDRRGSAPAHRNVNTLSTGLQQLTITPRGRTRNKNTPIVETKGNTINKKITGPNKTQRYSKAEARARLASRVSISPNTKTRANRKIVYGTSKTATFTNGNIQMKVNQSRKNKEGGK
jgi:hypothetical protein